MKNSLISLNNVKYKLNLSHVWREFCARETSEGATTVTYFVGKNGSIGETINLPSETLPFLLPEEAYAGYFVAKKRCKCARITQINAGTLLIY